MFKSVDKAEVDDLSLNNPDRQNEQINAAIYLLETGDSGTAENLIREVIGYNKEHPTANLLLTQLTQSAEKIFNTSRFAVYRVKPGDSLGEIAKEWLGNPLYFVSLAKLNGLSKPTSLKAGDKIKIPVTEQSALVRKEQTRSAANLRLLGQYRAQKNYYTGLHKANSLFIVENDLAQLLKEQQLILDDLNQSTASLSDRGNMLDKLNELVKGSRNDQQREIYQTFIKTQSRQLFLDEALLLFEDQSYIEAAERLVSAKSIEKNIGEESAVFRMEKLLLNKLHEQAVVLYRNHSLEQALDRWRLVLQLEPNNELAQKYTERTNKLLKKLNQY